MKIVKTSALFFVTAFLLWLSLKDLPFVKLKQDWNNTNLFYLSVSSFILIFSHILRAERWKLMLTPLGYQTKLATNFFAVMVGYFINLAIPRGGEVSRCISLYRMDKVPINTSLGSVVAERVIDLMLLFILLGITLLLEFQKLVDFFSSLLSKKSDLHNTGFNFNTFIFGFIAVVVLTTIAILYLWKTHKLAFIFEKIKAFLGGLKEGMMSIFKLEKRLLFLIHSLLIWFCYILMTYYGYKALPVTQDFRMVAILTVFVAGAVAMSLPLPGGTGTYHAIVPAALLLYGINLTDGLSIVTIFHLWQTLTVIIIGAISFILSQVKTRNATS